MRKIASKAAEKGKKLPIVVLPQFSLIIVVLDIETYLSTVYGMCQKESSDFLVL